MGFRDDDIAARSRAEALQRELDELRKENESLKNASAPPQAKSRVPLAILPLTALAIFGLILWLLNKQGSELGGPFLVLGLVTVFGLVSLYMVMRLIVVPLPGRIMVLAGRTRVTTSGKSVGFRVLTEGSTIRLPLLEVCDELPAGPFRIESEVQNVYMRDGPVTLHFRGQIAVAREEPLVNDAVERFLGREEDEIIAVGRDVVEAAMRGAAAELRAEDLRKDRIQHGEALARAITSDLEPLGLVADSIEILDVTVSAS